KDHKLNSLKLIMPVWKEDGGANSIVNIPLLGLRTIAQKGDSEDMQVAIKEILQVFIVASERHGLGISAELQMAGWQRTELSTVKEVFELDFGTPVIDDVMDTGLETAVSIDVPDN